MYQECCTHLEITLTRADRRWLNEELQTNFAEELLVLSSQTYSSIIVFCCNFNARERWSYNETVIGSSIQRVAKQVVRECKDIRIVKSHYNRIWLHNQSWHATISSPKLKKSLSAWQQSPVQKQAMDLQVALGVLLRDSKMIINHLFDYRVTYVAIMIGPTLQEFRLQLQALLILVVKELKALSSGRIGTSWADNFDTDISSDWYKLGR